MSLESIETLRIWSKAHMRSDSEVKRFIDAVEREISERYVELPKDADGEPIRVGDEVVCINKRWTVTGLRLTGGFWGVCCTIFNDQGGSGTNVYPPDSLTHYKPPTVEDVMVEFATDLESAQDGEDKTAVLKEYAAKLRLVEEDE